MSLDFITRVDASLFQEVIYINVQSPAYGAVGDGTTDDRAALNNAITAAGSGGTLYLPSGDYLVNSNLTFPASVTLLFDRGARLKPANGVTITILGIVLAQDFQIFTNSLSGQGTISFVGNRIVGPMSPHWWGATADGQKVTDAVLTSASGIVTSASALFTPSDVGKLANAWKEGGTATIALGTIASYQSATQVTLSNNASASDTGCALRWGTDDRAAINAAIAAVVNKGGGRLLFPRGTYKLSATFDVSTNSIITFPAKVSTIDPKIDITLEGECWDFAGLPHPTSAVDFDATGVTGSGTQPSVIAPKAHGTTTVALTDFSSIQPRLSNMRFVLSENPAITGLQFHNVTTLDLDRITVSVDSTNDVIAEPTTSQSYAVILPGRGNDTQIYVRGGFIQGFYNALSFSEHFKPWGLQIRKCKQALIGQAGFHLNAGQLLIEQCGVMLSVEEATRFDFQWVVERNDADVPAWNAKQTYDVVDASNLGEGDIHYLNALSYTGVGGASARLTRNGGFKINLDQIDNPSGKLVVVSNSANISIANNTPTVLTFDTDDQDQDDAHSTATNTDRINNIQAGSATVTATVQFAAHATGIRSVQIRKWIGGTPFIIALQSSSGHATIATTITVTALTTSSLAHYFDVVVFQDSGGALNVVAASAYSPKFTMIVHDD